MAEQLPVTGSGILDPANPLSFAFGGNTGAPSYQELLRRRAIAQAIASQRRPFPKNVGEGIAAVGEAVGDRMADARLTGQERAFTTAEDAARAKADALPGVGVVSPRVAPAPTAGGADAGDPNNPRNRIVAALYTPGGPGGAANVDPTPAAGVSSPQVSAQETGGLPDDGMRIARRDAIGGIESGGRKDPYRTVGVNTKYGPALGRYGVVVANVGPYTKAALGQALTPEQFLADDKAQDAVFDHRFGQYVARYGEENAARAWFGGPGNINKTNLTDAHERLSIGDYGKDYLRRLRSAAGEGGAPPETEDRGYTETDEGGANPPTPTAIRPMPAGHGVRVTSDALPSNTAIPPASEQTMPDPGPEPKPPERVDFSPKQRAMVGIMNSRSASPEQQAWAKQQFDMEEKVRTEIMARRENDYTHGRARWEKQTDEYNKFKREAEDRKIEQMVKRLGAEKTVAELEKTYFERGETRELALEEARRKVTQAGLNIQKSEREAGTWDERVIDGQIWRARPATATTPQGPWELAPGSPKKENLTETQAKTVKFMQRAVVASSQLGDASVLAGLKDTATGKIPIGGNYWVSPEYQKAQNAAFTWAQAVLRDESGAVLGASEIANKMKAYFPQPGDSAQTIRDKAFRRKAEEDSFYHGLGDRKKVIDDWREERKGRRAIDPATKAPYPEDTMRVNNKTGVRQRVMGGHWENEEDLR